MGPRSKEATEALTEINKIRNRWYEVRVVSLSDINRYTEDMRKMMIHFSVLNDIMISGQGKPAAWISDN